MYVAEDYMAGDSVAGDEVRCIAGALGRRIAVDGRHGTDVGNKKPEENAMEQGQERR